MTDSAIYSFLAARRKFISAVLGMAGVLSAGGLGLPPQTALVVQAIVGFLTVYGVHEVANDPIPAAKHAAP